MTRAPFRIPALLRFPGGAARQDGWGRLLELNAGGAVLTTATPVSRAESVIVHFELAGERLKAAGSVVHVELDGDGHWRVALHWTDQVERRKLAKALADALARA